MEQSCRYCHVPVRLTDFYCYNCGRNLHEPPKTLGIGTQVVYYIGSILLPPMGFFWGVKFLKDPDEKTRRAGIICIALTVVSLLYFTYQTVQVYQTVSSQVSPQIKALQGL